MNAGQVVLVRNSANQMDDTDKAIKKGKNDMLKLINETWQFLDSASKAI